MQDDFRPAPKPVKSVPVNTDNQQTKTPDTTSFITPDQMASLQSVEQLPSKPDIKQSWHARIKHTIITHKRDWAIGSATIIFGGIITAGVIIKSTPKPVVSATKPAQVVQKAAPKPTTVASTLSGLQVDPAMNQKTVTGVMIENSVQARPQSGLAQASVVFEAIAEGGITRFLALFQDTAPEDIGPVRSARPYYVQWALGFDAGYAHVGGSPQALANIREWNVRDLDQFANGGSYRRTADRQAPHNVYTSMSALKQLEATKGYTASSYTGFGRTLKETPSKKPTAKAINLAISGPTYNVHYDYDSGKNSYNRSQGGAAHTDAATGAPLSPKVVVAFVMPYSLAANGFHSQYATIGTGAAYIFQDGNVTIGQWAKVDNTAQFTFSDPAGKPIKLNPGQTWLTALRGTNEVTFAP